MTIANAGGMAPIREGLFVIPEGPDALPQLLGSECPACRTRFAGKRAICLECAHRGVDECRLSPYGTIHTFTIIHQTPKGSVMEAPYSIAQVQLEDGPIVQTALLGIPLETVRVGMPVEMALHDVKRDDAGNRVVAYVFQPRRDAR